LIASSIEETHPWNGFRTDPTPSPIYNPTVKENNAMKPKIQGITKCHQLIPSVHVSAILGISFLTLQIAPGVTQTDGVNLGTSNTVPAASNSIASGSGNATTNGSIAVGNVNFADNYSIVFGDSSTANWGSIAGGGWNTIDPNCYYMTALGEGNYGGYSGSSVLLGTYNSMGLQWGSAAIGISNVMQFPFGKSGSGNVLLGQLNRIDVTNPTAPDDIQSTILVGTDNESSSTMAFAFGKGNIGQTDTVTIGTYAATVSGASLIVGKGTGSSSRSNGLVVLRNGEVQIPGSLVVAGSPALSMNTAISNGFVNSSNFNAVLANAAPPTSSAWTSAYIPRGNVTPIAGQTTPGMLALGSSTASGANAVAMGLGVVASGYNSIATGGGTTTASASYARASGYNSVASAQFATANGNTASATGWYSFSNGWGTSARSTDETVFGRYNIESQPLSSTNTVNDLDGLFRVGNGSSASTRSDAITTLKNGETTLTNKAWKGNPGAPLEDPPSTTDSNGNALVVNGHTVLNGKVIIAQPQGDVSMGIYQDP
jgi:hypothetical protein